MERIREVSSQKCYPDECVRKFNHADTVVVKQRYYIKKFDKQREYALCWE